MRIFVGPLEIAGIGAGWVQGLRDQGVHADLVCAQSHRFDYGNEPAPARVTRWWMHWGNERARVPRSRPLAKGFAAAMQHALSWAVLAWSMARYDAFVLLYGESITNTRLELPLLRAFGKKVVVVFVGSDARPPYIDGGWFPADRPCDPAALRRAARRQQRKVSRLERQADLCVNARATAHFHRKPFVDWFALGIPRRASPGAAAPAVPPRAMLRLLHCPSHPVLKGTARIGEAVARLRARGLPLELVTIDGRPHAEVLEALRTCDLALDQYYSDTPMAAFATEAASLGCAVLVGGYAAACEGGARSALPAPPTRFVHPDAFESALEALATDGAARAALAERARSFVAEHWSPAAVAGRLLCMLRGDIPAAWWCDPSEVAYLQGCGLAEQVVRDRVRALVERFGATALCLEDKPALRDAFVAFARAKRNA